MGVKNQRRRDFICSPVVKTSPSNDGVWVQSLVNVLRSHVPLGQKPNHKTETIFLFYCNKFNKDFKNGPHKKKILKKRKEVKGGNQAGTDLEKDLELSRAETGTRSW